MAINIKNPEAEELLNELKSATGRGTTDIICDLLKREVEAERRRKQRRRAHREGVLDRICREARAKAVNLDKTPDEIIGYDEHGLPS